MKTKLLLVFILFFLFSCNFSSDDEQAVTSAADESFALNNYDAPEPGSGCYADKYKVDESQITRKLDIILVPDTSGSIIAERGKIADGFHKFVEMLPEEVDYNIGVILAHSGKSNKSGKLYKKNHDPYVLKSSELTLNEIQDHLKLKIKKPKTDGYSDGGEMGLYSILKALEPENLQSIKDQGLFRDDAALMVIFIADEQDICATYPEGVIPVPDPQGGETRSYNKYCLDENGNLAITPELVHQKLLEVQNGYPLVAGGVLYDWNSVLPVGNEDEIGYGYHDVLSLAGGINVDLDDSDYGDGLSRLGRLATTNIAVTNSFILKSSTVDSTTIRVEVDGRLESHSFNSSSNEVSLLSPRDVLSTAIVTYCDDKEAPIVEIYETEDVLTANEYYSFQVSVDDSSPVITQIKLNGVVVKEYTDSDFEVNLTLVEGINIIEIQSSDYAMNYSEWVMYPKVVLDTTAPTLTFTSPSSDVVRNLNVLIAGESNEPLDVIKVNGAPIDYNSQNFQFNGFYNAQIEGPQSVQVEAIDLLGNKTIETLNFDIVVELLREELISIVPTQNETFLVSGLPGTAYPGVEIEVDGGIFNTKTIFANADGSFSVEMSPFNKVNLTANLESSGRFQLVSLHFNQETTLTGIVKDTDGNPLPGVTITIESSGQSAITNQAGTFAIPEPITGDQTLVINGTTIPDELTKLEKRFSQTKVNLSIGAFQQNVLPNVVYMTPLLLDGTDVTVEPGINTVVTSPHAPGVVLNIPANSTSFPDGSIGNKINMMEINSNYTTIPVPEFAVPDTVISLEPSGLTFSTDVELTLPNYNELPPGTEMVILSKNSANGRWEIDGAAEVTQDGNSVITKPGMGISHFSEVYASPLGPKVSQKSNQDKPGTDVFNGALSNSISLPSYKSLGQDISPSLIYNSRWADPNVVVTNIFDIPRNEITSSGSVTAGSRVFGVQINQTVKQWIEPEYIDAQYVTNDTVSEKYRFSGIPNESVISYAIDLNDQESGIYPYSSQYEIQLKRMTLVHTWRRTRKLGRRKTRQGYDFNQELLDEIFKNGFVGNINLINKSNSNAGSGWKIGGYQKILNPKGARVLIEESNGGSSTYVVQNNIDTIIEDTDGMKAVDLLNYPLISYYDDNSYIKKYSHDSNQSTMQLVQGMDIKLGVNIGKFMQWIEPAIDESHSYCKKLKIAATKPRFFNSMFNVGSETYLVDDEGQILKVTDSTQSVISGGWKTPVNHVATTFMGTSFYWLINGGYPDYQEYCKEQTRGSDCLEENILEEYFQNNRHVPALYEDHCKPTPINLISSTGDPGAPSDYMQSEGFVQNSGFNDSTLTESLFNSPYQIIPNYGSGFVLSDMGNNRVRLIDPSSDSVVTIAGNGTVNDTGDGGKAIDAGLFHPRGLAFDSNGNLYVSTENGYIRKIDPLGNISTYAGKSPEDGGVLADETNKEKLVLNNPSGLVIDHENNYLYVADTGNNRVIQIDMLDGKALNVAGSGGCIPQGNIGDGGAALSASLCSPEFIGLDDNKNLLIHDSGHKRVRRVIFNSSENGKLAFSPVNKDNSSLVRNPDGTFERHYRSGSTSYFNSDGTQAAQSDKAGRVINCEYDSAGNLLTITDPVGKVTTFDYNSNHLLSSITDPAGRMTVFSYEGNLLTNVVFPDGTSRDFEYDQHGNMTAEYDQRSNKTEYQYNEWRRLIGVKRANNTNIEMIDSASALIANNYTGGSTGTLKSNDDEEIVDGIKDAKGNSTVFSTDINGYVQTITDADDKETTIERNLDGLPIKITRPDNSYTTFTYDPETNDLISQYDSSSDTTTSQIFDEFGNMRFQTNARGFTSQNIYNEEGLIHKQINPKGHTVERTYYGLGLVKNIIQPLGQTSTFEYDSSGNLSKRTNASGDSSEYTRDSAGNITEMKNAKGDITKYEYDNFNRLIAVITPLGNRTEYSYLPTGELVEVKDPEGNKTTFNYDELGRLASKVDPLGNTVNLEYDANGNVTRETDPNGNVKLFEYDKLNQLVKKSLPDNLYEMSYDIRGNIDAIRNNESEISFDYTIVNGESVVSDVVTKGLGAASGHITYTNSYTYDSVGNRKSFNSSIAGNTVYNYDEINRLVNLTNPKGEYYTFGYDANSRLRNLTRPGTTTTFGFDDSNFLNLIEHKKGGTLLTYFSYSRDAIGNRTQTRKPSGDHNYSYDSDGQLLTATNPDVDVPFQNEVFEYDKLGNRTKYNGKGYEYDTKGIRLTEDYKYIYVYDRNGNLTSKQEKGMTGNLTNYIYSTENQLVRVEMYESSFMFKEVDYIYDALGRRIEKKVQDHTAPNDKMKSFTRRYAYDGQEIIVEFNESNERLAYYTHSTLRTDDVLSVDVTAKGVTEKVAQVQGSYHYLKDALGSITSVSNSSGQVVQSYKYSSFGKKLATVNFAGDDVSSNPILNTSYSFTGREYDTATGLMYFRMRYYDASSGRFIQQDPLSGTMANTITQNRYIYAGNSPRVNADPNGTFFFSSFMYYLMSSMEVQYYLQAANTYNAAFGKGELQKFSQMIIVASVSAFAGSSTASATASTLGTPGSILAGTTVAGVAGGAGFEAFDLGTFRQGFRFGAIMGFQAAGGFDWLSGELGFNSANYCISKEMLVPVIMTLIGLYLIHKLSQKGRTDNPDELKDANPVKDTDNIIDRVKEGDLGDGSSSEEIAGFGC
jgi:RHS repeat-associated protein